MIKLVILRLTSDLSERKMLSQDYVLRAENKSRFQVSFGQPCSQDSLLFFNLEGKKDKPEKRGWLLSLFLLREPNILRKSIMCTCALGAVMYIF